MTSSARPASLVSRPVMFWSGVALTCAGVGQHVWMFVDSASMGFHMAMMGMSGVMWAAMAAIVVGVVVAGFAVTRTAAPAGTVGEAPAGTHPAHRRRLIGVLSFALMVDQMKPATLAFIQPGMRTEFQLSAAEISWLPTVALSGTVLGSLVGAALRTGSGAGRRSSSHRCSSLAQRCAGPCRRTAAFWSCAP